MCKVCGCGAAEALVDGLAVEPGDVRQRGERGVPQSQAAHGHDRGRGREHGHHDGHGHDQDHDHGHGHGHDRDHGHHGGHARLVRLEQDLLAENDDFAAANRRWLAERGVFTVNLVSSPGSGKTALLARSIAALASRDRPIAACVIEGDQQTSLDAERIRATGAAAVQINTGKGCHLDAHMVGHALHRLQPVDGSLLLIENVGNLVCPAAFDLGEAYKVVILSVTEGEDKPLKYPDMFRAASLMLLNKVDLLPHLDFDVGRALECARRVNPELEVIMLSARTGAGFDPWLQWLADGVTVARDGRHRRSGSR